MIEKFLTKFTDVIITINDEDFLAMSKMTKRNKHIKVYKVNGVGIDTSLLEATNVDNSRIRRSLGFSENDFLIITVGDLNSNKNQEIIKLIPIKDEKGFKHNLGYGVIAVS